jgi:NADPH oxidase
MVHKIWRFAIILLWLAIQAFLFTQKYIFIMSTPKLQTFRRLAGPCLPLARASAIVINFNSAIILLMCCRITITWLRSTRLSKLEIPWDDAIGFHKYIGFSIGIFSLAHSIAHYVNITYFSANTKSSWPVIAFLSGPGSTGHILIIAMLLITVTAAFKAIRMRKYELFYFTHKLFYAYFICIYMHGMFCFIKTDDPLKPCIAGTSWIWITPSLSLYLIEHVISFIRARRFTYVSKVILHQSKVYQLQLRKPSFRFLPGQYTLIKVPSVSHFQWHPFTITSAPEDGFVSVHINVVGDWTQKVAEVFGIRQKLGSDEFGSLIEQPAKMPNILIDGPYGAPCQDFSKYEVIVCIGAGIGQTPFSSILRSIWYTIVHPREEIRIRKLIYIGICRSVMSFEWFHDVLKALESEDTGHFLELRCFFTGPLRKEHIAQVMAAQGNGLRDPITGLQSPTYFGRPNFEAILGEIKMKFELCHIGVFYCGPNALGNQILTLCSNLSDSETKISFHKENF